MNQNSYSGYRGGFKLRAKLRARMQKLEESRIDASWLRFPKIPREFHGGHATVSKAFLSYDFDDEGSGSESSNSEEGLQSDGGPRAQIREPADHGRDEEGELGDEDNDEEEEHGSESDDLRWEESVAVKKSRIGDNKDIERLLGLALRETEFLVELSHPNIVEFKGFVEDLSKDIIWLVFPWAQNGNLKDFVASRDWEIPERISLINDVAGGLDYLHSRKPPICHGDLKSFNVLVNSKYCAMITDFGSARRLTKQDLSKQPGLVQTQEQPVLAIFSTLSKTITLTGNIYTLRWAAPELLFDDQISLWSDIWALGWIAYEVLTNFIPFQDVPADAVVVERVIQGDLPSIEEHARVSLFEKLCTLMTMCWNSNPSERPTAKDYLHAMSDMPMAVPDNTYLPDSRFSSTSSSKALMRRGERGLKSGDTGTAFACFTEALRIYTRIGDREGRAEALWGLAEVHRVQSEYKEAIKLYSEALQIRPDIADRTGQASALSGLAQVHRLRNEYSEAVKLYSEALQIRPDIGDSLGKASTLSSLAEVHRLRSGYSKAITLYSEALEILTDVGERTGQASVLSSLAQVHRLRKDYTKATKLYSKALQIRPDIDDSLGKASALSSLAQVHRLRNDYSEAITLYSEALEILTDIGDRTGQASALSSLAQVHRLRNDYIEAITFYSKALKILTNIGDRTGQASALSSLAQVHRLQNDYSAAIKFYSDALKIRPDINDSLGRASALSSLAQVHRLRKEYNEAIKLYSEALQIHTDIGDRQGMADAQRGLDEVRGARNE